MRLARAACLAANWKPAQFCQAGDLTQKHVTTVASKIGSQQNGKHQEGLLRAPQNSLYGTYSLRCSTTLLSAVCIMFRALLQLVQRSPGHGSKLAFSSQWAILPRRKGFLTWDAGEVHMFVSRARSLAVLGNSPLAQHGSRASLGLTWPQSGFLSFRGVGCLISCVFGLGRPIRSQGLPAAWPGATYPGLRGRAWSNLARDAHFLTRWQRLVKAVWNYHHAHRPSHGHIVAAANHFDRPPHVSRSRSGICSLAYQALGTFLVQACGRKSHLCSLGERFAKRCAQ